MIKALKQTVPIVMALCAIVSCGTASGGRGAGTAFAGNAPAQGAFSAGTADTGPATGGNQPHMTPDAKEAGGYIPELYFGGDDLPDLVACLPAPPEPGSAGFAYDSARYEWGKSARSDLALAHRVERDAVWDLDTLLAIFSEPFGMELSREKTPRIHKVFVDGKFVGRHVGSSDSFEFDITALTKPGKRQHLVVEVADELRSFVQTGGKQSQRYESYGCAYTRTTGIWQTVWLEAVPKRALRYVQIRPDLAVPEGNSLRGTGIVFDHQAVIPRPCEAVCHCMIRAGLEGKSVSVLPSGDHFDIVHGHVFAGKGIDIPAVGIHYNDVLHPDFL